MICIENKEKCCGCAACSNICPRSCIKMMVDEEGFLYPQINKDDCINCGLCDRVCPEINYVSDKGNIKCLAVQCVEKKDRARSTAGGGVTPLANWVLENRGVVYGAAYDKDFVVKHIAIDNIQELGKIQGSKYVQSVTGNVYREIKDTLKQGRMVLFSGTPCQVAGLYNFLKVVKLDQSEKLLTVSVACRAVPSPMIFEKYIEMQKSKFGGAIESVCCRDKFYGYSYSTMSIYSSDKTKHKDYHCSVESDEWLRCFFSGVCDRPCCESCEFDGPIGDFQIGDYFRVKETAPELDDNLGTTRMVIGSEKGLKLFEKIQDGYRYKEISNEQLKRTTQNALSTFGKDKGKRDVFFADAHKLSGEELFEKYYPRTIKVTILQYGRFISYRLGIYDRLKRALMKIKNKR